MQRAIYVEVDFTAFVSKIARGAVLTRVKVRERGQVRIHSLGTAFVCLGVHGGLFIKMRRRIHPNEVEVFGTVGACPDGQGIFEILSIMYG